MILLHSDSPTLPKPDRKCCIYLTLVSCLYCRAVNEWLEVALPGAAPKLDPKKPAPAVSASKKPVHKRSKPKSSPFAFLGFGQGATKSTASDGTSNGTIVSGKVEGCVAEAAAATPIARGVGGHIYTREFLVQQFLSGNPALPFRRCSIRIVGWLMYLHRTIQQVGNSLANWAVFVREDFIFLLLYSIRLHLFSYLS